MTLREKIKLHRKQRGWSQAELSERIGVNTVHVSHLETGRYQPSVELLKKLAQTFEVTADYLLNEEEGDFSPVTSANKSFAERLRLIESLEQDERDALCKLIDALLTKKKVFDMVARETQPIAH